MTSADLFEKCMKCTVCNDFCPLAGVVEKFPGPKKGGPDGERLRLKTSIFFDRNLKYCLNCKRCEVACPSNVNISDLILKARMKHEKFGIAAPRNLLMASTDVMGTLGTAFHPVANFAASLMLPQGGPRYASRTFVDWFRKEAAPLQEAFEEKIHYFHGCYVNYNNPQQGMDLVKVLNAAGIGVEISQDELCCGVALITNGFRKIASHNAKRNLKVLSEAVQKGRKIVSTSSSCTLTIRNEYNEVLGLDNSFIKDSFYLASKYLHERIEKGDVHFEFKNDRPLKIAYHTPCHMAKLGWNIYSMGLLRMIPGVELVKLDENCCGVAGTYGFKPENKKTSDAVGKVLFDQIEQVDPDIVATDCETCRWQIEMHTGRKVLNPVSILASLI